MIRYFLSAYPCAIVCIVPDTNHVAMGTNNSCVFEDCMHNKGNKKILMPPASCHNGRPGGSSTASWRISRFCCIVNELEQQQILLWSQVTRVQYLWQRRLQKPAWNISGRSHPIQSNAPNFLLFFFVLGSNQLLVLTALYFVSEGYLYHSVAVFCCLLSRECSVNLKENETSAFETFTARKLPT